MDELIEYDEPLTFEEQEVLDGIEDECAVGAELTGENPDEIVKGWMRDLEEAIAYEPATSQEAKRARAQDLILAQAAMVNPDVLLGEDWASPKLPKGCW